MKPSTHAACLSLALVVAALSPIAASAQSTAPAPAYTEAQARQDIGKVVEEFRLSIITRDKPRFLKLFPEGGRVAWQDAISDANLQGMRKKKPDAKKVHIDPADSHVAFIDKIVAKQAASEETFDDIRIDTDGDIASVAFDYRFLQDGRETNRGREAWSLVRTDAGWKIVSVVWSMRWEIKPEAASK